jgi:hypothetical protein
LAESTAAMVQIGIKEDRHGNSIFVRNVEWQNVIIQIVDIYVNADITVLTEPNYMLTLHMYIHINLCILT